MGKVQTNTRLDEDNHDRLQAYCERKGLTKAEAVRRFIRDGLDEHERERRGLDEHDREGIVRHGIAGGWLSVLLGVLAIFGAGTVWELGTAFGDFLTLVGVAL